MDGLTESERKALEQAQLHSQGAAGPDDLMQRVYEKSGLDPLEAHARQDRNQIMARVQGPFIAMGGLLLAMVGGWRLWNAWSHSAFSIGGLSMLLIGLLFFLGGLAGTVFMSDED